MIKLYAITFVLLSLGTYAHADCVSEGGSVPTIPNAPKCCDGLKLEPYTDNRTGSAGTCVKPAAAPLSCSEQANQIQMLQKSQYAMESTDSEHKNLYALMRAYDEKLAAATIAQDLYALNQNMQKVTNIAPDKEVNKDAKKDNFSNLMEYLQHATSDESLNTMKMMATMDALIKELDQAVEGGLLKSTGPNGQGVYADINQIMDNCQNQTAINTLLCQELENENTQDATKQMLTRFIESYIAHNNNAPEKVRKENLNQYRTILNTSYNENADFQGLYEKAAKLHANNQAFARIKKVEDLIGPDGDYNALKRVQCCRHTSSQEANADALCKETKLAFDFNKCAEYSKGITEKVQNAVYAAGDFQSETNDLLNYSFNGDDLKNEVNLKNKSGVFGWLYSKDRGRSQEINKVVKDIGVIHVSIEQLKDSVISNLTALHRRGKLNHPNADTYLKQSLNLNDNGEIKKEQFVDIATRFNSEIKLMLNCGATNPCPQDNFLSVVDSNPPHQEYVFQITDKAVLTKLFDANMSTSIAKRVEQTKKELETLKSQINAIKSNEAYAYIDKIKHFLLWDLKNRCATTTPVSERVITICRADGIAEKVDFLAADVGQIENVLITEADPTIIKNNDLTNATLAQSRVILASMNGACQGLNRLRSENSELLKSYQGIDSACPRIQKMVTQASEKSESERREEATKRYGSYDGDGRIIPKRSTWQDISKGVATGLPNAVGTMANPFFSGLALKNSIPSQEAYWKQMKLNNYAQNWWMNNVYGQYPYGFYSPYYYPNSGGYNFSYTNQNTLNTTTTGTNGFSF